MTRSVALAANDKDVVANALEVVQNCLELLEEMDYHLLLAKKHPGYTEKNPWSLGGKNFHGQRMKEEFLKEVEF